MKVETEIRETGTLPIKVRKEVVGHLSLGLYRNFARAIKELISNSYDAGAMKVKIKLNLNKAEIIVRDDGRGMDIRELEKKFLAIGYPTPLEDTVDDQGRKRIGTFGIGCLSVFPYCKRMQIVTKRVNEDAIIKVTIDTQRFFKGQSFLIEDVEVPYEIYKSDLPTEKGETIIVLEGIRPHIAKDLRHKGSSWKSSIDRFSGFEKFRWTLGQYCPIQFPLNRSDLRDFFDEPGRTPMRLWLDGEELFRNVPENAHILQKGEERFGDVALRFAIMTPIEPIQPEEARGLQVRFRDVAVGLPRDFDVVKLKGRVLGKLNYLCGEVHILHGLESALMIDRDSFSYTQEMADIDEFFRKKLAKWNATLEKWARDDKSIYEALKNIKGSNRIVRDLKNAGVLRIPKERLRIPKKPITQTRKTGVSRPSQKIVSVLSKKSGYKVVQKKGEVSGKVAPIEVKPKQKSIIVYRDHPSFTESIEIGHKAFRVEYDEWKAEDTPYSICKMEGKGVVFNTSHPLFESKLSDEIVKRLSLGLLLIVEDRRDKKALLTKLNRLLEDTFGR